MSYIVIFQDFSFALALLAMAFSKADVLRDCVIITYSKQVTDKKNNCKNTLKHFWHFQMLEIWTFILVVF